nr:R-phycoerythrin subunit beta [Moritella viscosa]
MLICLSGEMVLRIITFMLNSRSEAILTLDLKSFPLGG